MHDEVTAEVSKSFELFLRHVAEMETAYRAIKRSEERIRREAYNAAREYVSLTTQSPNAFRKLLNSYSGSVDELLDQWFLPLTEGLAEDYRALISAVQDGMTWKEWSEASAHTYLLRKTTKRCAERTRKATRAIPSDPPASLSVEAKLEFALAKIKALEEQGRAQRNELLAERREKAGVLHEYKVIQRQCRRLTKVIDELRQTVERLGGTLTPIASCEPASAAK